MTEQSVVEGEVQVVNQPLPGEIVEHRVLISKARAVKAVESPEQYGEAGKLRVELDLAYKAQKGANDVFCKGLSDMHRRGTKRRSELLAPYLSALSTVDKTLDAFRKLEQEKREAKEREIAEELRKKAEEDAIQAAIQAEEAGDDTMAEAIIQEPVEAPPVKLQSAVPKVQGLHKKREIWKARVVNAEALRLAIHQNKALAYLMIPDEMALNQLSNRSKGTVKISGVEFFRVQ